MKEVKCKKCNKTCKITGKDSIKMGTAGTGYYVCEVCDNTKEKR